jgi:capsular exopolysaccharide synthesis family protein
MQNLATVASSHAYVRVLRRWWWLPVVLSLVSGTVTYVGTVALIPPEYGSSIELQWQALASNSPGASILTAATIATDMTSRAVRNHAWHSIFTPNTGPSGKHRLPYAADDPDVLWKQTSCVPDATNFFITCTATSRNVRVPPSVLGILANDFISWDQSRIGRAYVKAEKPLRQEIRQERSHPFLKQQVQNSLDEIIAEAQIAEGSLTVISPAVPDRAPVSPHPLRNALLGGIIGIGLAAALIVLLEYLDDTFRSADEIVESTNLPLLGSVRKYDGAQDEMATVAARMPRTAIAEAYRVARANIQFTEIGGNLKVLVVTSARDGEGKTTTANNLATTFALAGQRVLLVDADLRRPGLTKLAGLRDSHGLSSALLDPDADVVSPTEVVGLSIVPSGAIPPNPSELLGSQRMRSFVEKAAQNYDLVILDTPPVLSVADTRILATVSDGIILVLDPAITTRRMVSQARIAVENVGGRILGIILNRDVMRGEGYYYNYYYYERRRERDRSGTRT